MTFNTSLLFNDKYLKFFNYFPGEESDSKDSSIFIPMNDVLDNGSSSSSLDEEELYYISKKILKRYNNLGKIFKIESAKKKRGPKKKKETKKAEHNAWAKENIISKIQRHYLNFIISFLNDSILSILGEKKRKTIFFLNINNKVKSKSSSDHIAKMKKSTISDILKNSGISDRYKYYDENTNKMNVEALIEHPWFKEIFERKYLDLFLNYYNDEKPLKELMIFDKKVILSKNTKSFYYLLHKQEELKDRIIYFCKKDYLSDINDI